MAALEDLAAKLGMDPLDFFLKNLDFVQQANLRASLQGGVGDGSDID